jgi:hypothetical protein
MRKALLCVFVVVVAAAQTGLWHVAATAQIVPDDDPTFYFTRLVYSENSFGRNRGRSRGTMAPPALQFICPEFGGGNFFPMQGWGWGTDYPGGDCKFMGAVHRLTGIRVHPNPNVVEIMDEKLFKFPFVYAVEVGGMYLDKEEAERLREYLLRGGFLHVDDFWGPDELDNLFIQMQKVFPDRQFERLQVSHPVFNTFFNVDEILQIPNRGNGCNGDSTWEDSRDREPVVYGISDDSGRLMVLVTYNSDLGDAWEYMDLPCYPAKFSGAAYRMGLNFMIYAMSH